jgi:hypothetical protein
VLKLNVIGLLGCTDPGLVSDPGQIEITSKVCKLKSQLGFKSGT